MNENMGYDPSYIHNINAAIERDRDDIVAELVADYDAEHGIVPSRTAAPQRLNRWRHRAARVRKTVDDYTIETFNPTPLLPGRSR